MVSFFPNTISQEVDVWPRLRRNSQDEGQGSQRKGGWKVISQSVFRRIKVLENKILKEHIKTLHVFKKWRGTVVNISVCFKWSASGSGQFTQLIPWGHLQTPSSPCPCFKQVCVTCVRAQFILSRSAESEHPALFLPGLSQDWVGKPLPHTAGTNYHSSFLKSFTFSVFSKKPPSFHWNT